MHREPLNLLPAVVRPILARCPAVRWQGRRESQGACTLISSWFWEFFPPNKRAKTFIVKIINLLALTYFMLSRRLEVFSSWVKRRLPPHLRDLHNYFFFAFSVSASICLVLLTPWLFYLGMTEVATSGALSALLVIGFIWLWWRGLPLLWAHLGYQLTLMGVIFYNVVLDGGVASSTMVWLAIVPLLPLFTMSRAWAFVWLLLAFLSVLLIYWLQVCGWIWMPPHLTRSALAMSATMYSLLCVTQMILVMTYDSTSAAAMRKVAKRNTQLRELSIKLTQANAHKDKFLATVSHELRTPLNAVMGYLGLMIGDEKIPPHLLEDAQHAQSASEHLLMVINDLLDYSQIQQGQLVLTPQIIDLRKVLTVAHQSLAPRAQDKGLLYKLFLTDALPVHMRLDPHRLTQILLNLLGNAIKFTNQGEVNLHVDFSKEQQAPFTARLLLRVSDTGIGIPAQDLHRVFEPFVQLQHSYDSTPYSALKGNGLGLAITRSLIDSWGGVLRVESQPGQGTYFDVELPVEVVSDVVPVTAERKVMKVQAEAMNLLLVDDHPVNRMVARATILRTLPNAQIDEAGNGQQALRMMQSRLYDLVLMDLVMPDLSGVEVVQKIREEAAEPYRSVNVVAFTANVSEDAAKACHAVGMDSMLPKPFNAEALINLIKQHIPVRF